MRRTVRRVLLAAIAGLYILSIPWYRGSGAEPELWLGLPDWVTVALLCYASVALLNSVAWLLTEVADPTAESALPAGDTPAGQPGDDPR